MDVARGFAPLAHLAVPGERLIFAPNDLPTCANHRAHAPSGEGPIAREGGGAPNDPTPTRVVHRSISSTRRARHSRRRAVDRIPRTWVEAALCTPQCLRNIDAAVGRR